MSSRDTMPERAIHDQDERYAVEYQPLAITPETLVIMLREASQYIRAKGNETLADDCLRARAFIQMRLKDPLHEDCEDRCQLKEHKGYSTCFISGGCAWLTDDRREKSR